MTSINRIALRDAWARYVYADTRPRYRNTVEMEREAFRDFDAWLADSRAAVWEEGRTAGRSDTHDHPAPNPYKAPCGG